MNSRADNPELDALLGAYALDALDADERRQVEEYLAQNPSAQSEVDELRETAASLALSPSAGADEAAPPELWQRISQSIAAEPKSQAPVDELAARRERRRTPWVVAVASVAAAIALVLGAQVVSLNGRLDDNRTVAAAFDRAAKSKDAKNVALQAERYRRRPRRPVARRQRLPEGGRVAEAARRPDVPVVGVARQRRAPDRDLRGGARFAARSRGIPHEWSGRRLGPDRRTRGRGRAVVEPAVRERRAELS